jgi:5-deoxy-glucuronate isomerase
MTRREIALTQSTPSIDNLLRRVAGPTSAPGIKHDIRPAEAGWKYVGLHVQRLAAGEGLQRAPDDRELAIVVLEGRADVRADGQRYADLGSRDSVFDGPAPPVLLLEPGSGVEVEARSDTTIVMADAPAAEVRVSRLFRPDDIHVETRGGGITERRIHHLLPPGEPAGRLILFEVFTPGGNWSSYPPHKHDTEDPPREAYLEELYYYRFARPEGWGFARVYTPERDLDMSCAPADGDVLLIPRGYHPFGAPAGYDAYYLNVMAGPNRAWHFTVDPDHAWLMDWDPDVPK